MLTTEIFVGRDRYLAAPVEDRARLLAWGYRDVEPEVRDRVLAALIARGDVSVEALGSRSRAGLDPGLVILCAPGPMLSAFRAEVGPTDLTGPPAEPEAIVADDAWIEIVLVDDEGQPVPGAVYELTLPNGSVRRGRTDAHGLARHDRIPAGNCDVSFVELDADNWRRASS